MKVFMIMVKHKKKNWKDIFDNIRKQGEYLIPRAGGGLIIPEKKIKM